MLGVSERFTSTVLWSPEHRLMVGWSPKAGCTMVKRHLIEYMGLTDAAAETGKWVQTYSYHYHQKYIVIPAWEWGRNYLKLKFVRNPYHRFVSSYSHAIRFNQIAPTLARDLGLNQPREVSFEQFLGWVEQQVAQRGWKRIDPHIAPQYKKEEARFGWDRTIPIENMKEELAELARNGGPNIQHHAEYKNNWHHVERHAEPIAEAWRQPYEALQSEAGLPDYDAFYTENLRQRVAALYADDFVKYGYGV